MFMVLSYRELLHEIALQAIVQVLGERIRMAYQEVYGMIGELPYTFLVRLGCSCDRCEDM